LRRRAGIGADGSGSSSSSAKKKKSKREEELEEQKLLEGKSRDYLTGTSSTAQLPTTNGHINFFQDLEQGELATAISSTKKATPAATDKGVPLAPSEKDLNPWYSSRTNNSNDDDGAQHDLSNEDAQDEKRLRDTARKTIYDPLTSINQQLSKSSPFSSSRSNLQDRRFKRPQDPIPPRASTSNQSPSAASNPTQARLARESSERERALALIRRKKREMMGSETPSTVHGGMEDERGYGDIFDRKEVGGARRGRERGGGWRMGSGSKRW